MVLDVLFLAQIKVRCRRFSRLRSRIQNRGVDRSVDDKRHVVIGASYQAITKIMSFGISRYRFCKFPAFRLDPYLSVFKVIPPSGAFTVPSSAPQSHANPLKTHSNKQNTINLNNLPPADHKRNLLSRAALLAVMEGKLAVFAGCACKQAALRGLDQMSLTATTSAIELGSTLNYFRFRPATIKAWAGCPSFRAPASPVPFDNRCCCYR